MDHLRTRFTLRLYEEWHQLLYRFKLKASRPLIVVVPMDSRLGDWEPLTRTIRLSEQLLNRPWHVVSEVLRHEMAHLFVHDECDGNEVERPHGERFHYYCRRLGMSDWAMRSEMPMDVPFECSQEEKRLLDRVQKLLSLATSDNEHEALAAMKKVRQLQSLYQLDSVAKSPHIYRVVSTEKQRLERYYYKISSILCDHFFVDVVFSREFCLKSERENQTLEIHGTPANVQMAEYVYHFLHEELRRLWERERGAKSRQRRGAFYLGVLTGFSENLSRDVVKGADGIPLVVAKDPRLEDFVGYRFPRLSRISHARQRLDSHAFEKGRDQGKSIVLRRPIENRGGERPPLLTQGKC